jgi:hypothetical protein
MNLNIEKKERVFYLEKCVFPLLDFMVGSGHTPATVEYKGTCFLIRMGNQHVFITAKHLLHETPDKYNLYLAYNTPEEQASYLKISAGYVNHVGQDISFFLPTRVMKEKYEHLFIPMELLRHPLPIGQGVLVYGFPNSGQQGFVGHIPIVNIQRTRYEGKVLGVDHDPLPPMKTIYRLDIPSPPGLSGSPVIVIHNNTLAVAGYIIGEQTTNNGERFAVATDFTPFVEIQQLLIDVSRKLASARN